MCEGCGKQESRDVKWRIAKRAAVALAGLPEPNSGDERSDALNTALRSLLAEFTLATNWDRRDAESYERTLDFAEVALEYATDATKPSTAATKASECGSAKRVCNEECHATDGGYFCFVDCRLEYITCLASVIWRKE
jgi:hypothetical protein